jgi:hypothetical protein
MRNLEIINSEIASLEAQLETAKTALYAVEDNHKNLIKETWVAQLGTILEEGDNLENDYSEGIRVSRIQVRTDRSGKEYNYKQEIYNICRSSYGSKEGMPFQLSTYSTTVDNDFEFDRLITVGKVAAFIKENNKNLVEAFRMGSPYNSAEQKEVYKLGDALRLLNNEKSELQRQALLTRLETEGVEFAPDKYNHYPSLDARWDWSIRNICKIKVVKKTASGKSADLEVVTRYKDWDGNIHDNVTTADKVRMDKVESLLSYYRESIVA